jgi:hypothetical protein
MRAASWLDRRPVIADALARLEGISGGTTIARFARLFLARELDDPGFREAIETTLSFAPNPRLRSAMLQIAVEMACYHERDAVALALLEQAAAGPLVDLDWYERCPALDRIRGQARFEAGLSQVRQRAQRIWAG